MDAAIEDDTGVSRTECWAKSEGCAALDGTRRIEGVIIEAQNPLARLSDSDTACKIRAPCKAICSDVLVAW